MNVAINPLQAARDEAYALPLASIDPANADRFLDTGDLEATGGDGREDWIGRRIGPYRVTNVIAAGNDSHSNVLAIESARRRMARKRSLWPIASGQVQF